MTWQLFWTITSIASAAAAAICIISVLRHPREPRAMLAWVFALLLLPLLGAVLFLLLGEPRFRRTRKRRQRRRQRIDSALSRQLAAVHEEHQRRADEIIDPKLASLVALTTRIGYRAPAFGNQVTIFNHQDQNFKALVKAIQAAESHVHLEYYIFQPDDTGHELRNLLIKKAAEGVACRVLVDYVGCWHWSREFTASFHEGGVQLEFFLPVVPWRAHWRINFRNHRKIAVIDGRIGFTGSQNIGDEYRGRRAKFAPYRDTHMRLIGPAVHQLQEVFVDDWHYATGEDLVTEDYFPRPDVQGEHAAQIIASGPDMRQNTLHHMLLCAAAAAEKSIAIVTPYFAPDMTMILAFQNAAYRGVRVQLLVPTRTDSRMTLWAGRSFYQELSSAGVEVYEYNKLFLHSKIIILDDAWAMVGSANMDQRSFRINYEITTLLYNRDLAEQLREDFESLRYEADRFQPTSPRHWTYHETLLLGLARLVSPLL